MNKFNFLFNEEKNGRGRLTFLVVISLFAILFSSSFINAAPPFTSVNTVGIVIEHPIQEVIKVNQPHSFHFHLFNATDGKPFLNSSGIVCAFHLYNQSGIDILVIDNVTTESLYDWVQVIPAANITTSGTYAYVIQCNNSAIGGYYTNDFEVTPSGFVGTLGFYILILVLSLGIIILGFSKNDAPIVVLGAFGLVFVGLYVILFGIDGFRDYTYTWAFGIITIMLASYIGIKASYELIAD
jgi:hypothetical protein